MSSASDSGVLEAVDRILNRGGDADDVLRDVVRTLHERGGYPWVALLFVEDGSLVVGPQAGETQRPDERLQLLVAYQGSRVAELVVDGASEDDRALLERVAVLVSAHCLVGWDTGGEPWNP
jgi:hypothetical protein